MAWAGRPRQRLRPFGHFELVDRFQVAGKHTHDARLAALLLVQGVRRLLTFNTTGFPPAWGVEATHPSGLHQE
jgi:hypothetical protein